MKIIYVNKYTQNEIMTNQILDLFVLVVISPFFGLVYVYVLDKVMLVNGMFLEMWHLVKIPMTISVLFWFFSLLVSRIVKRVLYFYLLLAVMILIGAIPIVQITIWLAPSLFGVIGWFGSIIVGVSFLFGYWDYFNKVLKQSNAYANAIDRENGEWNVRTQIQLDDETPAAMKKQYEIASLLGILLIFVPGVVGRENFYIGIGFLVMISISYFLIKRIAKPAALAVKMFGWEQEIGKPIRVISE